MIKVGSTTKIRWLPLVTAFSLSSFSFAAGNRTPPGKDVSPRAVATAKTPDSKPQVSDAWVRLPPPGSQMVAVYMTIANPGPSPVQLARVEVEGAMSSTLHQTSIDQAGISSMRTVAALDIPPGESKSLAPGGLHVMVMGLNRHLREGDRLSLSLTFKNQPPMDVTAVVKP